MNGLSRLFAFLIARRWYAVACHALLLIPSVYFAAKVRQDNSLDRLITATDPDYVVTRGHPVVAVLQLPLALAAGLGSPARIRCEKSAA